MARMTHVHVRAPQGARRRAGFAFGTEAKELPRSEFADDGIVALEQLLALLGDPHLICILVDEDGNRHQPTSEEVDELGKRLAREKAAVTSATGIADVQLLVDQLLGAENADHADPAANAPGSPEWLAAQAQVHALLSPNGDLQLASGGDGETGGVGASPVKPTTASVSTTDTSREAGKTADTSVGGTEDGAVAPSPSSTTATDAATGTDAAITETGPVAAAPAKPAKAKAKPTSATPQDKA